MAMAQTTKQAAKPAKAAAKKTMDMAIIVRGSPGRFSPKQEGALALRDTDDAYIKSVADTTAKLKAAGFPIYATRTGTSDPCSFAANHQGKKPFA